MSPLNRNQVRHVLSTFEHVDQLLQGMERLTRDERPPFARERPDLSPEESRLLLDFIAQARGRLLAALDRLDIPRPQADLSARWSVDTGLTFAEIALAELTESGLRAYGAVNHEVASELVALAADLRALIGRGKALLHEHDAGGLRERLAALTGVPGEILRAVERISAEHGIASLRPAIAAAAERAGSLTFDVGVFGRVSAGKSSLINTLIDHPVLPVGATPVTSVPVRIGRGEAGATVRFVDGDPITIPLDEIATYATETHNPDNRRGVRAVEARVPDMPPGLRFLDTPGVGSLATSGPAQAYAWLPRCDLGLVLVAAGSAIGREELALVAGLGNAGIACRVLLSKSDLLDDADVERAIAYVRRQLDAVVGERHGIAVLPVSVMSGRAAHLAALRREVLAPLAADHERAAAAALRQRLRRLIAAANAALDGGATAAVDVDAYRARTRAADDVRRIADRLTDSAPDVLRAAAERVADAWANGGDPAAAARQVIIAAASDALGRVRGEVERAAGPHAGDDERARHRMPPLFDPEFLDSLPPLEPPALGRQLIGRRVAQTRLEAVARPLANALARYSARLHAWATARLEELPMAASAPAESGVQHDELNRLASMLGDLERDAALPAEQVLRVD